MWKIFTGRAFISLAVVAVLALVGSPALAKGGRVAVLPVEDLSQGANGYSPAMSSMVSARLKESGFRVVSDELVMDFLVRNRVRWLGYMDSQNIAKLHEELGVDFILLASVNQLRGEFPPAFGLTAQLVRAKDAKIVWASGGELCRMDVRNFLGLDEPESLAEVQEIVVRNMIADLPVHLTDNVMQVKERFVEEVRLEPEVVQPGEEVRCQVKLLGDQAIVARRQVFVSVAGARLEAQYSEDDGGYEAAWPASVENGRFPVTIDVISPAKGRKNIFAGSYLVDGVAPRLDLQVRGPKFEGKVVLRDKIAIVPILLDPEPTSHWEFAISAQDGSVLMAGAGKRLPERLIWQGQTLDGAPIVDGIYTVKLSVWDRAKNKVTVANEIRVLRRPPQIDLSLVKFDNEMLLDVVQTDAVPLAYWRFEVQNKQGDIVQEERGEKLPVKIAILAGTADKNDLRAKLFVQDVLGNQTKKVIKDLALLAAGPAGTEEGAEEQDEAVLPEVWTDDF